MHKISKEWWFLAAGVAALVLGLILQLVVDMRDGGGAFAEGLCIGLSLSLFFGGLGKVRRDARRGSTRDSDRP